MRRQRLAVGLLLLVVPPLLAACAARRNAPRVQESYEVVVRNDLLPPTSVTVWLLASPGTRDVLGNVSPGATRSFRYRPKVHASEYRLAAETAEGRRLASRPFRLEDGDEVEWLIRTNTVNLGRQVDP